MNKISRRILVLTLFVACFYSTNIIASRPEKTTFSTPDCIEECVKKRDKSLESCSRLSPANKTRCENLANDNYNKCTANCNTAGKPAE